MLIPFTRTSRLIASQTALIDGPAITNVASPPEAPLMLKGTGIVPSSRSGIMWIALRDSVSVTSLREPISAMTLLSSMLKEELVPFSLVVAAILTSCYQSSGSMKKERGMQPFRGALREPLIRKFKQKNPFH